jgi:dsRNA-specific ribonuclease
VHNIREGSDHSPIYTATANLNGISAEGKGSTKKKAEQLASETVLGLSFF